jgi:hypothetical protein
VKRRFVIEEWIITVLSFIFGIASFMMMGFVREWTSFLSRVINGVLMFWFIFGFAWVGLFLFAAIKIFDNEVKVDDGRKSV